MTLKSRQPAPPLEIDLLAGGRWSLADAAPRNFTIVVFYRGLHCPICKRYLSELEEKLPNFTDKGMDVIAISADSRERAERSRSEWGLAKLPVGYGLRLDQARAWDLFISSAIRETEPAFFTEPGLFVVQPAGTLFASCIGSASWARPPIADMLRGLLLAIERGNPARGEM